MTKALESVRTWFTNSTALDQRTFDIVELSNGKVLVGFGGALVSDAVYYTATLNLATDTLGPLTSTITPISPGGSPASTLRVIDLVAGNDGRAILTGHYFNASTGEPDTGLGLVTQVLDGATPLNDRQRPVNPGQLDQETSDKFSTVVLADGSYAVFFSEPGTDGFADLSNGLRMTRFSATGAVLSGPRIIIADRVVNDLPHVENNAELPSAVLMSNRHIGLLYKESLPTGSTSIRFQELKASGAKVGGPVDIAQGVVNAGLSVLDDGRMLATWFEFDGITSAEGTLRGRFLTAGGNLSGKAFDLTDGGDLPSSNFRVTAISGNGFAVSWNDGQTGLYLAQAFDGSGDALGNPFLLHDLVGSHTILNAGIVRQGDDFLGWSISQDPSAGFTTFLEGQLFSGESSFGDKKVGNGGANSLTGGARDDILVGKGGKDTMDGLAGNDRIDAGGGNDILRGGDGFDWLEGAAGNDQIGGGDGTDILDGGTGRDRLNGEAGADRLNGGADIDVLTGGAGADRFLFASKAEAGDRVTDFNVAEGDKIVLKYFGFGFLGFFLTNSDTTVGAPAGLHFNTATHVLTHDADGDGTFHSRTVVAELPGVDALSMSDILTLF